MTARILHSFRAMVVAAVASSAAAAQAAPDLQELNRVLTDEVVVPAYGQMAEEMARLSDATTAFCDEPDAAGLAATWDAFGRAMTAWQRAQVFTFGPIIVDGRAERIEFWPDKNGTMSRQLAQAMAAKDPALLAPGGLDGKSVALQSLVSFEQLLGDYGAAIAADEVGDEGRYACGLAMAIADFQKRQAEQILIDWTGPGGYRAAMVTAADGNSHYGSAEEAAAEFLRGLSFELEKIVKMKLRRPLGDSLDRARPKRAESWRSGLALSNIKANLETAAALYEMPGGFGDQVSAAGEEALDSGLRQSFAEVREILDALQLPMAQAVTDKAARERLETLGARLEALHRVLSADVSRVLALPIGFNAMDGD